MNSKKLTELRECVGGSLPDEYEQFLLQHDDIVRVRDVRQRPYLTWEIRQLMGETAHGSILEPVNIAGKVLPFVLHIQRVLCMAIEFGKGAGISVVGGGVFTANNVSDCIAIGEGEENTLFLKISDGSVWYLWHATNQVEKVASSLQSWLDACEAAEVAATAHLTPSDKASRIVGLWIPVSSRVLSENVIAKKSKYELLSTSKCLAYDLFGDTIPGTWKLIGDDSMLQLHIADKDGDRVYIVERLDGDTLVLVGPDGAPIDVTYERRMD